MQGLNEAEMREAIAKAREVLEDVDWGIPAIAGRDEPLAIEVALVKDGSRKATFYLDRGWDVGITNEMELAGIPSDLQPKDAATVVNQSRFLAVRLLNEQHAWDPIERDDGTFWAYRPPTEDEVGTSRDPRVRLALQLARIFTLVKSRAFALGYGIREVTEGNSVRSSEPKAKRTRPSARGKSPGI